MQNLLFEMFEQKCVLEVCVHIYPIMIKIQPVGFVKIPILKLVELVLISLSARWKLAWGYRFTR